MDGPTLVIFYNTQYPRFSDQRTGLERRDPVLGVSFTKRYEIWLAVHSLILHQDQKAAETEADKNPAGDDTEALDREREERTRIAKLAAMFAAREVELPAAGGDAE